ncbi:hypothetical protein HYW94_02225 [Candidatus Uhrbacteria bacterium]|nr:hypothetical protein [Candidatus Uhrbacteria bacterium]
MKQQETSWKDFLSQLAHDIFFTSFFISGVSFVLEFFYPGAVVNFFNLKIVFIVCIGSGVFSVLRPPHMIRPISGKPWEYAWIGLIALIGGIASYQFSPDIWRWRWVFSGATAIALASVLFILSRIPPKDPDASLKTET